MNTLTCGEVADLLPELALEALDDQVKRDQIAAHIDVCPNCRERYETLTQAVLNLAMAVPQTAPPPQLKQALMEQVAAGIPAPDEQDAYERSPAQSWRQALRSIFAHPALMLSALLAVAALAGYAYLASRPAPVAPAIDNLDRLVVESSEAIKLNGTAQTPDAWADLRFKPDNYEAVLVVGDLQALDSDKIYQLWLVDGTGKRDTGALFNCGSKGTAKVLVSAPRRMRDYVRFGVTIEPAGGSPGPTGPGVLRSVKS
jgi:anti-sigma-K factor RskA